MVNVEVDRRADVGSVRDQGELPTCLSHATSMAHRHARALNHPLSAEALHYHATGANWSVGSTISSLRSALRSEGQPEAKHCAPISPDMPEDWAPPAAVPIYRSETRESPPLPQVVEQAIRAGTLPVLGLSLPAGFFNPNAPWVISAGPKRGAYHAVAGIGLGEFRGETVVMIRNSWGDSWADSGDAWLDRAFLNQHLEAVVLMDRGANQ